MESDAESFAPVLPRYSGAALSDILPSALAVLQVPDEKDVLGFTDGNLADVRRIVVLLVDGLGYRLLAEAAASSPTLAAALGGELGQLRHLTTNFPSTTPASLASLSVGAPPGQHGITGFTVNVPGTQQLLTHIYWDETGPDPLTWQPLPTCYERAAAAGVATTVVQRSEYSEQGLTKAIFRGGQIARADGITETAREVGTALSRGERSLVYAYVPHVDKRGHEYGPGSAPWHAAVANVDRLLRLIIEQLTPDSALLVTADHGMIDVPDDARIDIAAYPRLRDGVRILAGEPRARYVHTQPGAATDVAAAWRETLGERVEVLTRDEAVAQGRFGEVAVANLPRIGDLVVTGTGRHAIFDSHVDPPSLLALRGLHGGMTAAEMGIPLLSYRGV